MIRVGEANEDRNCRISTQSGHFRNLAQLGEDLFRGNAFSGITGSFQVEKILEQTWYKKEHVTSDKIKDKNVG